MYLPTCFFVVHIWFWGWMGPTANFSFSHAPALGDTWQNNSHTWIILYFIFFLFFFFLFWNYDLRAGRGTGDLGSSGWLTYNGQNERKRESETRVARVFAKQGNGGRVTIVLFICFFYFQDVLLIFCWLIYFFFS